MRRGKKKGSSDDIPGRGELELTLSSSEMLGHYSPHVSAYAKRYVCVRIKSFGTNHGVSEKVDFLGWRLTQLGLCVEW